MALLTPASVRALLAEHGLRPSRRRGQHFVADPNTARRIVRLAGVDAGDRVLEIGAGLGSLTLALRERGCTVLALEIDQKLVAVLEREVADDTDVRVVAGDALTVDFDELLGAGPWSCVSNLPYNVATPVVIRLLEEVPSVTSGLVMVQREVAERLVAAPGSAAYGAPSVKVAYYADDEDRRYGPARSVRPRAQGRLGARRARTPRHATGRRAVSGASVPTRAGRVRASAQDAAAHAAPRARRRHGACAHRCGRRPAGACRIARPR